VLQHYPPRFDWPGFFDPARIPTWIAVVLLAVEAVIVVVWRTDTEADDGVA
jgi:hypothetical protein